MPGTPELAVIFVLVLILFGPDKLPELARNLGKGIAKSARYRANYKVNLSSMTTDPGGLLAIVGGTGIDLRGPESPLQDAQDEVVTTRWGNALVTRARYNDRELVFLQRHAAPLHGTNTTRRVPPHCINYRANIAALKKIGVTGIFASFAVGSLRREWPPATLVLLDQFIDATTGRIKTFFHEHIVHIDVTEPFSPELRSILSAAAASSSTGLQDGGTYLCTDGPRFETPAEIRMYAGWGADVVGMTGVPEAVLAREANIAYAGIAIVTNAAAGISETPLTQSEVLEAMHESLPRTVELFLAAANTYRDDPATQSRNATAEFKTADFDPEEWIVADR